MYNYNGLLGDHRPQSCNTKETTSMDTRAQDEKSTNQNSGVHIDAIGHDGNKDNYFGAIEEI